MGVIAFRPTLTHLIVSSEQMRQAQINVTNQKSTHIEFPRVVNRENKTLRCVCVSKQEANTHLGPVQQCGRHLTRLITVIVNGLLLHNKTRKR